MGQFGAGGIDLETEQTYMGSNNQAHLFICPFYPKNFVNVTSNRYVEGGYYGRGYLVVTYQPYYLRSAFASPKAS